MQKSSVGFSLEGLKVFSSSAVVQNIWADIRPRNTRGSEQQDWDQAVLRAEPLAPAGPVLLRAGPESVQPPARWPEESQRLCWINQRTAPNGLIMESLTHERPCVRGASSRVAPTCALVDVCVCKETEGQDSHALLALSGCCLFFFFLRWTSATIHPHVFRRTRTHGLQRTRAITLYRMEGKMGELEQYIYALKRANGL